MRISSLEMTQEPETQDTLGKEGDFPCAGAKGNVQAWLQRVNMLWIPRDVAGEGRWGDRGGAEGELGLLLKAFLRLTPGSDKSPHNGKRQRKKLKAGSSS